MMLNKTFVPRWNKPANPNKVYLPAANRENHYLLLEVDLVACEKQFPSDWQTHCQTIITGFFNLCQRHKFKNAGAFATDKLVRVRYGEESQLIETNEQIILMYDPENHVGFKTTELPIEQPKRLVLVILATGKDIRFNAAKRHRNAQDLAFAFSTELTIPLEFIKLRDHQHVTYDLFASAKGDKASRTHEFRSLVYRYRTQDTVLPNQIDTTSYMVAHMPFSGAQQLPFDQLSASARQSAFDNLTSAVSAIIAKQQDVQVVIVGNGKQPVVRTHNNEHAIGSKELSYVWFDDKEPTPLKVVFNPQINTDSLYIVMAFNHRMNEERYGRQVNALHDVLAQIAAILLIDVTQQQIITRVHQHCQYNLAQLTA